MKHKDNEEPIGINAFMKQLKFNENMKIARQEEGMRIEAYRMMALEFKYFYDALVERGFSPKQALELTKEQVKKYFQG